MIGEPFDPSKLENYRFERKFTTELGARDVAHIVKLNPGFFREIFAHRQINNIYFDSEDHECLRSTVEGFRDRIKVRIRWYGDTFAFVAKPVLEVKQKEGLLGAKASYPLPSFSVEARFDLRCLVELFDKADLPRALREGLRQLKPVLLNTYERTYFLSEDKNYRITIDDHLNYYRMLEGHLTSLPWSDPRPKTVIELKYGFEDELGATDIASSLPFRMTKNSKYEDGLLRLLDL